MSVLREKRVLYSRPKRSCRGERSAISRDTDCEDTHQLLRQVRDSLQRLELALVVLLGQRRWRRDAKLLLESPRRPVLVSPSTRTPSSVIAVRHSSLVIFVSILRAPPGLGRVPALLPTMLRRPPRRSPIRLTPPNTPIDILASEADLSVRKAEAEQFGRGPVTEEGICWIAVQGGRVERIAVCGVRGARSLDAELDAAHHGRADDARQPMHEARPLLRLVLLMRVEAGRCRRRRRPRRRSLPRTGLDDPQR